MKDCERERKLPKWAQNRLDKLRMENDLLRSRLDNVQAMNAVMCDPRRDWFTVHGPNFQDEEDYRDLFVLYRNGAHAVCSIGRGDLLFVGRTAVSETAV
jgi:regulator of replication initiation timing